MTRLSTYSPLQASDAIPLQIEAATSAHDRLKSIVPLTAELHDDDVRSRN